MIPANGYLFNPSDGKMYNQDEGVAFGGVASDVFIFDPPKSMNPAQFLNEDSTQLLVLALKLHLKQYSWLAIKAGIPTANSVLVYVENQGGGQAMNAGLLAMKVISYGMRQGMKTIGDEVKILLHR